MTKGYFTLLLCLSFCLCSSANLIKKIQTKDEKVLEFSMPRQVRVSGFSWSNCGGDAAGFANLSVTPDPLKFPGSLQVSASLYFNKTVQAPLAGQLLIEKELFGEWIKIPCIDGVGSCSYSDICAMLAKVSCPDPYVKAGIPCKCPFKEAMYNLPQISYTVGSDTPIPSGGYHLKGSVSMGGTMAACLDIYLKVD